MKPWQKGVPMETLRPIARAFAAHDAGRILGAFGSVKENTVAAWIAAGRLYSNRDAHIAARRLTQRSQSKDFRGVAISETPAGGWVIDRVAGRPEAVADLIAATVPADAPLAWKHWAGHPGEIFVAQTLGLIPQGSSISAASEIRTLSTRRCQTLSAPLHPSELLGIAQLRLPASPHSWTDEWAEIVESRWQNHYSSYNKRKSWHAVGLRTYGGDPSFIEKPAEMSKGWKAANPDTLDLAPQDTELLDLLPHARELLDKIPGEKQRVRLMKLNAGGELSRHADITDREAGMENGLIARLHLPIVTNPGVQFTSWSLDNEPQTAHMTPGSWWYLDVRKPHAAINTGTADRVHLVADIHSSKQLRELLW